MARKTTTAGEKPAKKIQKTNEEILESGTALERAALWVRNHDSKVSYSKGRGFLSEEEEDKLWNSFKSAKEKKLVKDLFNIGSCSIEYAKVLVGLRKQWQTAAAELTILLTRWEGYEREAKHLNKILSITHTSGSSEEVELLKQGISSFRYDGAELRFLPTSADEAPQVEIIVEGEDTKNQKWLYNQIKEKQENAAEMLSLFKSWLEPFSEFLMQEVTIGYGQKIFLYFHIPAPVESLMDYPDATEMMYHPEMNKFFSYRLRQMREQGKGDQITPEMEKWALIPDYNQVGTIPNQMMAAKRRIATEFPDFKEYVNE